MENLSMLFFFLIITYVVGQIENRDEFVDGILSKIRPEIKEHLDPVNLPSAKESFEETVWLVTFKGVVEAYDGKLFGLSSLRRVGEAEISFENNGITIDTILRLDNLVAEYGVKARFQGIGPWFTATANVSSALIRSKFFQSFDKETPLSLTEFKINQVGDVAVSVQGLGPALDYILKHSVTFLSNTVKKAVASAIDAPLKSLVGKELGKISLSLESPPKSVSKGSVRQKSRPDLKRKQQQSKKAAISSKSGGRSGIKVETKGFFLRILFLAGVTTLLW